MALTSMNKLYDKYPGYLTEYMAKCESGEILIGQELMQMLSIMAGYLERPDALYDTFQSEIIFDTADSHKRIKFIEKECKHYEAPFAGKPFILTLRQKAFIEAFYSFKIFDKEINKWVRLYQEYLMLIARKCGKSPLVAAMDLAEWFCGEMGTKILCASNDYAQADIMFQAINAMREESPSLAKVTRKNIKGIFFGNPKQKKKKGKFSYQNKGCILKISAKAGAKEGRNIKVGSVDEVHEMKDNSLVMPIRQALSTQDEPIYGEITTEGFVRDGYLDERLKEARKVLRGELERPRWLIWLHTQDSEEEIWQDERTWVKSNPDLGVIKKWSFLRQMVEEAKESSATRAFVLSKDFNLPQSESTAWLPQSYIVNLETFDLKDFTGAFYISGNDFAETTDLCASTILLKKPGDKKTYFHTHYWIPESKLEMSPDDVDYRQWEREGWLTIVDGNSVDSSLVAEWHYELLKEYDLKPFKSGYDNRFAKDFQNKYLEIFGDKITVNIPQDFKVINNPMRTLEADMRDKLVVYQNNPVCYWCFCNTGITLDKLGRIMPAKMETSKRIDGTVAKIIAYATLEWHRSEFMSLIK
ncbi:terminase large subunit [Acetivibrio straminisolvens]|uniref:terminase large subunit n=2 Tax=Acetivibrio straminisolvens TaxID=253314 RepID=UPI002356142F|nr:terminase TerL endonuclease subunit [Acetivibrio straminisolvens]